MLPFSPHKEDIKAEIRKRGETLISLARKKQLSRDAIALSLLKPLPRANKAIADLLGVSVHYLWPKWYDPDGKRIPLRSSYKHSASATACRSKKSHQKLAKKGGAA